MVSKACVLILVVVCVVTSACGSSRLVFCGEVSSAEVAKAETGIDEWPEFLPDRFVSCPVGEYVFLTPAGTTDPNAVVVIHGGETLFVRQKGTSAIFESGIPVVDVHDSDNDGVFDAIAYSVLHDDRWDEITVRDRGLDGQPDTRTRYRADPHEWWLWIEGGWSETPRLGSMQVLVDGKPRGYEVVDGQYSLSDE